MARKNAFKNEMYFIKKKKSMRFNHTESLMSVLYKCCKSQIKHLVADEQLQNSYIFIKFINEQFYL